MKSLNKTSLLLLVASAFAVAFGVLYASFFIMMKNKTEETAEILLKIAELSVEESRALAAVNVVKRESANIEKISSYFIKESEVVSFAKKIEELGPQSGTTLSIEALDPGVTEKTTPYLGFRIKATGKFSDIVRLIMLLQNMPGKFVWKTARLAKGAPLAAEASTSGKVDTRNPEWTAEVFLIAFNFVKE